MDLPEVKRKQRKASYQKPEAVKELERMADAEARRLHPTMPHLAPRTFRDDSANGLTGCIVKYITLKGGFASRISNQGTFNRKLGKYIPSTSKRGIPDIIGTYRGSSLHVEVKHGSDRMSIDQAKVMQAQIASGGKFFVATDLTTFKEWFDSI